MTAEPEVSETPWSDKARRLNDAEYMADWIVDWLWLNGPMHLLIPRPGMIAEKLAERLDVPVLYIEKPLSNLIKRGRVVIVKEQILGLLPGPVKKTEPVNLRGVHSLPTPFRSRPNPMPPQRQAVALRRAPSPPKNPALITGQRMAAIAHHLAQLPDGRWNFPASTDVNSVLPERLKTSRESVGNLAMILTRMEGCGHIEQLIIGRTREYIILTPEGRSYYGLENGASETVRLGIDGEQFELEMTASAAQMLRTVMEPYTAAARRKD
jgi:hypothetical protein